ncbi:hypothetical protein [Methylobacterium gnaphalii]|uniref:Uncharacterized protein n=1 Tax=Methylobacterium gnaphalii TaxID=1010610 RepID=A0A512JKX1_9HYPH|nr:hypothetical protein [Methylobacterium gnaphalii]GEP10590.1 hypothetical protein MGN01_24350 [Methylobacterium gnaphalii]GJD69137.1 hypothetical protein MMMDOFMJ_2063 [Methylobacterium gnaphalii]GLS47846.1 hypothetical protein GCM10007885_06900 [Methylobacterium gnaphalii]
MTLLSSGALALAAALIIVLVGTMRPRSQGGSERRPCLFRLVLLVTLASVVALAAASPSLARRSRNAQATAANPTPANAGEAVCRSRARDYAYEKHADTGQELVFFDKCMGH